MIDNVIEKDISPAALKVMTGQELIDQYVVSLSAVRKAEKLELTVRTNINGWQINYPGQPVQKIYRESTVSAHRALVARQNELMDVRSELLTRME